MTNDQGNTRFDEFFRGRDRLVGVAVIIDHG